jgi:hypothetical protein
MSSSVLRKSLFVLVLMVVAAGLVRASLDGFTAKREAVINACQVERNKLGIKSDEVLYAKYPTPEITLITTAGVPVGGTGELVVKGKFVAGSKFLLESDHLDIVKEAQTATEYRATIKASAGIGPEVADLWVFSPVSGASAQGYKAVAVTGKFDWELQSSNGWRIKARQGVDTRLNPREQGSLKYTVEFYKGAETTPFQKREAELSFSAYDQHPFQLRVEEEQLGGDYQAQIQALSQKLMNPNTSDADRDKLMAQMQKISEKMIAQMSDASAVQKQAQQLEQRKKEFGCENIELRIDGGQVQGEMRCGELVGRAIKLTGSVKPGPIS